MSVGGLFVLLNMDFMGMILLVVYVGAIAILFVFVLMMLNLTSFDIEDRVSQVLPSVGFISIFVVVQMFSVNAASKIPAYSSSYLEPITISPLQIFGEKFYTSFDVYFILSSLVLLVAMVGTIVLTLNVNLASKKQYSFAQTVRKNNDF